jgi:hypothetical protein
MTESETEMRVHRLSIVAICQAVAVDGDVTDARMTAMQLAWALLQSAREASAKVEAA